MEKATEFQKNIYFCFIDYAKAFDCVDHKLEIPQEMGIPDHLTCRLRSLYAGQEATVKTWQGTTNWFQIWKGVRQGCILSPCLFNFYLEYVMRNAGLDTYQIHPSTEAFLPRYWSPSVLCRAVEWDLDSSLCTAIPRVRTEHPVCGWTWMFAEGISRQRNKTIGLQGSLTE